MTDMNKAYMLELRQSVARMLVHNQRLRPSAQEVCHIIIHTMSHHHAYIYICIYIYIYIQSAPPSFRARGVCACVCKCVRGRVRARECMVFVCIHVARMLVHYQRLGPSVQERERKREEERERKK